MAAKEGFISELGYERVSTLKMLQRLPEDKFDWKPHDKSMTLGRLAGHIAELPGFISKAATMPEVDFAAGHYVPFFPKNKDEAVQQFTDKIDKALADLAATKDEAMFEEWTLRNGAQILSTMPRIAAIRSFAINHMIHHRGQLSVYLRMLDVPVPSIYGPSADEGI